MRNQGIPEPISKHRLIAEPIKVSGGDNAPPDKMESGELNIANAALYSQAAQSEVNMNSVNKSSAENVLINSQHQALKRSKSLPSEKGTVNYLEDLALTQTMFEKGTLICHGEAEDFVNIIRTNRNSI